MPLLVRGKDLDLRLILGSFAHTTDTNLITQTGSRSVQSFLHSILHLPNTHTDHATRDIGSNRPHLVPRSGDAA